MFISSSNLPAALFTTSTGGPWSVPRQCPSLIPGNPSNWCVFGPAGDEQVCIAVVSDAADSDRALANALLLSEARAMWGFVLDLAKRSYTAQAADLIDDARAVLQGIEQRAGAAIEAIRSSTEASPAAPSGPPTPDIEDVTDRA